MAEKEVPIDVIPILPEDVNSGKSGPAPPSYEEVMGQYVTSVQINQPELSSLAYIDIMPRLIKAGNLSIGVVPEFQSFQEIVKGANVWLTQNPGLGVWKCETVERKVLQGQAQNGVLVDLDSMSYRKSAWTCNCYVFGIRMWLVQRPAHQNFTQEIGLINITPREKEIQYAGYHSVGFIGLRLYMSSSRIHTLLTYEGLRKTIEEFNTKVKDDPIPGSVLNVETATLKFAEGLSRQSAQEVAEMTSWHEMSGMASVRRTQVLRVFYVKGAPTAPQLQMVEFLPSRTSQLGLGRPIKFADFSDADNQAADWLRAQSGTRILNIETRDAKFSTLTLGVQIDIDTDSTDDFDLPAFQSDHVRFLRVFFTSAAPDVTSYENTALTTRIFPPVRLKGRNRFETMMQTMARIDAWLKVTGLPIFGVETVQVLDEGPSSFKKSQYRLRGFSGKFWTTAIRLYFAPPPSVSIPDYLPAEAKSAGSSTCSVL